MPNRSSVATRFLPSLADILFLAPIGLLCARTEGSKTLLGDGDTGWHIRTGEWIVANGAVPFTDMFSFTKPGQPWFAWEWLWDVTFALLHRWGGMAAVLLVSTVVICLTFALVYDMSRKHSANAVLSAGVTLMAVVASSLHWLARPHLFTLLFCVLFYRALENAKKPMLLMYLPLGMIVWTNIHGGFIVGLMLTGIYAAGEWGQAVFSTSREKRAFCRPRAVLFAQCFALCAAATLLNPYGYQLHQHLFSYLTDGYQLANIAEFQSISFHHPLSRVVELLLLLGVGAALMNLVRGRLTYCLLLLFWAHLALISGRNIPLFAIIATPLIASLLQDCLVWLSGEHSWLRWPMAARRFTVFCSGITGLEAIPRWHMASVAALAIFSAALFAPLSSSRFASTYDAHVYPARALQAIEKAGDTGRIFSTDVWGGYMIYRKYPQVKVFIDGRSDFYGPTFGTNYTDVMNVKPGWENHLRESGIRTVLVPPNSSLSGALKESKNWRCTYDDGIAIVFRPVNLVPANDKQVSTAVQGGGKDREGAATDHSVKSGNRPLSDVHT